MKDALREHGREMKKPTEGVWFEVKPQAIDQKLFEEKREDKRQEETRQLILEAFAKMNNAPSVYGTNFRTKMREKKPEKTASEMAYWARHFNSYCKIANWVEQALEWAQRIANGESWESICNDTDTANWLRLIIWKNGYYRLVGGSVCAECGWPATYVYPHDFTGDDTPGNSVVLLVRYEEDIRARPYIVICE